MVAFSTVANKVDSFISSLSLPQEIAKGVLHNEGDCHAFYIGFYGRNKQVVDDLLDYREERIEKSDITLDMFLEMCYTIGMVDAFINTFFQFFDMADIIIVTNAISAGKTSLEDIFGTFQNNPNENIMKIIL